MTVVLEPEVEALVAQRAAEIGATPEMVVEKLVTREMRLAMLRARAKQSVAGLQELWARQERELEALSEEEKEYWRRDWEDMQESLRQSRADARAEWDPLP